MRIPFLFVLLSTTSRTLWKCHPYGNPPTTAASHRGLERFASHIPTATLIIYSLQYPISQIQGRHHYREKYTSWGSENFTRENLIDHLNRHAYYGIGTVISTGSDKEEIALQVQLEQRLGQIGGARYVASPGIGTPGTSRGRRGSFLGNGAEKARFAL